MQTASAYSVHYKLIGQRTLQVCTLTAGYKRQCISYRLYEKVFMHSVSVSHGSTCMNFQLHFDVQTKYIVCVLTYSNYSLRRYPN